ncbi:hypothetical protein JTB14_017491 [Gonioctena quinquepunctata]|nr:hypothetical protein JTB14_017491 [Gonioctena quinquepunctata]
MSTEDTIAHLTNSIYKSLDEGKCSIDIFSDLAFDTVNYKILMLKLNLNSNMSSFADDTFVIYSAETWKDTKSQTEDVRKNKTWVCEIGKSISFSCDKNNPPNIQSLTIPNDGQLVEIVDL